MSVRSIARGSNYLLGLCGLTPTPEFSIYIYIFVCVYYIYIFFFGRGEWIFMGKEGARFEVVHELPCISREEDGSADIRNGS